MQDNLFNDPKELKTREPILGTILAVIFLSANPQVRQTVSETLHSWIAHLSQFIG